MLIDLKDLYGESAKLSLLPEYLDRSLRLAGEARKWCSLARRQCGFT